DFDILVGINLLREGLDLPEVSLVCILDADKEGFLRSQTSLIQTAGRAARHINGEVVLFADIVTDSMQALISISEYRRAKQMEYNEKHGITPQTVRRAVQESLHTILRGREIASSVINEAGGNFDLTELLRELEDEMQRASANLEFERAALLRDQIMEVKSGTGLTRIEPKRRPVKYTRNNGLNSLPEVEFSQLSQRDPNSLGEKALSVNPTQWKHGETEHFIYHFAHTYVATPISVEAEFHYRVVAKELERDQPTTDIKSHV